MKKLILLIICCSSLGAYSQECDTPAASNTVYTARVANDYFDGPTCVNVAFHIVRRTNGTGGASPTIISQIVTLLNDEFNPHSISINNYSLDYVNNDNLFNIDDSAGGNPTEFNTLMTQNVTSNAIDFYIVNSANYKGRANGILSKGLVVSKDWALSATSPHELGHCFNLHHTFYGTATSDGCDENINGSNCSTCGDYVCDTPADNAQGNNNGFTPDLTNLMSYYSTRNHFSPLQGQRMRDALNTNTVLMPVRTPLACTDILGPKSICPTGNYSFTFANPTNIAITWTVTPNLQVITSSNTGITVAGANGSVSGIATIYATIGNLVIDKKIWVGLPIFNVARVAAQEESCDTKYHYVYYEIVNRQPVETYTFNVVPIPGMNHSWGNNNRYSFKIPKNYSGYLEFSVVATNNCGPRTVMTEDYINNCSSLRTTPQMEDSANVFYQVYPNPSSSMVYIDLKDAENKPAKEAVVTGELYDLMGYVRGKVRIEHHSASLNVSDLPKGIYILKIMVNGRPESHRIAVN